MGRLSRTKRENPMRHKAFLKLRSLPSGGLERITTKNGAEVALNPMKHFLLGKMYVHPEFQNVIMRKIGQMTLGEEKYAALEKKANERPTAEVAVETKGV